jgi:ParB/RepB/Spo0J family partition protein
MTSQNMEKEQPLNEKTYTLLPLDSIKTMPFNMRVESGEAVDTLAESIMVDGVLEPLVVRPSKAEVGKYEVVCGVRRLRAAQKAGLKAVPCIVKELTDREAMEFMLVENMERVDLSDYELGRWFKLLMEKFPQEFRTQKAIADRFNLSESYVWRLIEHYEFLDKLNLPHGKLLSEGVVREIRRASDQLVPKLIEHAVVNERSARDMAGIVDVLQKTPEDLRDRVMTVVIEKDLNARETAELVKVWTAHSLEIKPEEKPKQKPEVTAEVKPKVERETEEEAAKPEVPKKPSPSLEELRATADQIKAQMESRYQQKLDRAGQIYVMFTHYYPQPLVDAFAEHIRFEGLSEEKAVSLMRDVIEEMWSRLTKHGSDYKVMEDIFAIVVKWR